MMGIVILVLLAAGVGYAGLCTLQGLTPTSQQLSSFEPELVAITRRFEQPPFDVWSAYAQAVRRTPGMSLREAAGSAMLIDLKPTPRVLGGNFGLVIRVTLADDLHGTRVTTDARNKVGMAVANHQAAFTHAERALRMNAKKVTGLRELIDQPTR